MVKNSKYGQTGRSMIEMMGYIAVVMVLTVSIGHLVSSAFNDYKCSKANMQVSDLADAISKAGAIEENYAIIIDMINGTNGVTTTQKKEGLKMIPSSFRVKDDSENKRHIYHAFGGEVAIGLPANTYENYENKFFIKFSNLNRSQCIELAMKDWVSNKYSDLYAIIINGGSGAAWYWPAYTSASGDNVLPVKRSAVAGVSAKDDDGQCKDTSNNTIMWIFN